MTESHQRVQGAGFVDALATPVNQLQHCGRDGDLRAGSATRPRALHWLGRQAAQPVRLASWHRPAGRPARHCAASCSARARAASGPLQRCCRPDRRARGPWGFRHACQGELRSARCGKRRPARRAGFSNSGSPCSPAAGTCGQRSIRSMLTTTMRLAVPLNIAMPARRRSRRRRQSRPHLLQDGHAAPRAFADGHGVVVDDARLQGVVEARRPMRR